MNTSSDFAAHCLDLFAGLGPVEARSMFGGHAFFAGAAMFAIGDAGEWRVWLKVDDETRARFEEAGGVAFTYQARNRPRVAMSFFTVPDGAMEDGEAMLPWARLALEAADRAAARRGARSSRVSKSGGKPAGGPKAPGVAKTRRAPHRTAARRPRRSRK